MVDRTVFPELNWILRSHTGGWPDHVIEIKHVRVAIPTRQKLGSQVYVANVPLS